jgi:hypothetical protein
VNSPTVAHRVAMWDDETGDAELVEYGHDGRMRRRAVISHWRDVSDGRSALQLGATSLTRCDRAAR